MDEGGPIQFAEDFGKFGFGIFDFAGDSDTTDRFEVTITAGAYDRENTIISYSLSNIMDDGVYLLHQNFNPARPHQYGI